MKSLGKISIENLRHEPYIGALCYPNASQTEAQNRVAELATLNVDAVEFAGEASAFTVPVLGKGYVGVVVVAYVAGQKYALKMRRMDADRLSLEQEAELLMKANRVSVGPKFYASSGNFLLMQLIEGSLLTNWLETNKDKYAVRRVLKDILEQCWCLDEAGLDHGELSKATKHLLIDRSEKPFVVDFETASLERRVANVTAVCQFLFLSNFDAAKLIAQILGVKSKDELVGALRRYKKNRTRASFEALIKVCLF